MKIVTDCAADLPAQEAAELGITVAPLFINFPEGQVNSADISADDFYNRLEAMAPNVPTTALPSPGIFADLYEKLHGLGEDILSIHISSGLSGTFNSARQGAADIGAAAWDAGAAAKAAAVHLFDSMTLSGGQRFQVLAAARAVKAGWSVEKTLERLEKLRSQTEVIYTLETLSYLARGGRIGRVQALAGALLSLKPIIRVERSDGKYSTAGKTRTIPKALDFIADHLTKEYGQTALWVSVMHGRFAEQAEAMAALLRQRLNIAKLEVLRISPVLGVHTGPGIVGATVCPIELMEDFS
jgi:DegV family protein with EDD domain